MKYRWRISILLVVVMLSVYIISQIKSNEIILLARYQELACEKCYHMSVERSQDPDLLGATIIPVSSRIDIEKIINDIALSKEQVCLRGKAYKFNFNFLKIDPDGKRFEVLRQEEGKVCAQL